MVVPRAFTDNYYSMSGLELEAITIISKQHRCLGLKAIVHIADVHIIVAKRVHCDRY